MRILLLPRRRLLATLAALLLIMLALMVPLLLNAARDRAALARSLRGVVVVVDPGHGGRDPGAVGRSGVYEKDIVLPVGLELAGFLRRAGATVVMTREDDRELTDPDGGPPPPGKKKRTDLQRRVEIVAESRADLLISVHVNAIASSRWRGAQAFYYPGGTPESKRLAEEIQASLRRRLGNTRRGIEAIERQYLLKNVGVPAVTVEIGFISNPDEAALLESQSYQRRLAWSIFTGVARYLMRSPQPALGR